MKLYLVKSAFPYFVAKQEDAKREARDVKCSWEQVEGPTSDGREALAAFLNTLGGPASITVSGENIDPPAPVTPPTPEERKLLTDGPAPSLSLTDAEEFIQNADAAQLASLSNNVCWRMNELLKGVQS
jgi:hypothetical protein